MDHPRKAAHLVVHELDDELLLYDPTVDRSHRLNTSAAIIWRHCDGGHSVEDLARMLAEQYEVEYAAALRDTQKTLGVMTEERIVAA